MEAITAVWHRSARRGLHDSLREVIARRGREVIVRRGMEVIARRGMEVIVGCRRDTKAEVAEIRVKRAIARMTAAAPRRIIGSCVVNDVVEVAVVALTTQEAEAIKGRNRRRRDARQRIDATTNTDAMIGAEMTPMAATICDPNRCRRKTIPRVI